MEFSKIQLTNFRQYYGEQTVRFAKGEKRNVTVINGPNGAGKTSLFSAINWCLYGEGVDGIGALVSKESALDKNFDDVVQCEVKLSFEHLGTKYIAIRTAREKKVWIDNIVKGNNKEEEKYKSFVLESLPKEENDFQLFESVNNNMKPVPDPNRLVNGVLPKDVRQYFLFDGEKIDKLTRPDHDSEIKDAIRNILQLSSIENSIEHLAFVIRELTKEINPGATGRESELYKQIDKIENQKVELDDLVKDAEKKHKSTRELKRKVEEDLRKLEAIKHLIQRRDELESIYESAKTRRDEWKLKLRNNLSDSYAIIAKRSINDSLEYLRVKEKAGEIPSPINETFVQSLINSKRCICGNDIQEDSEGYNNIIIFLEKCKNFSGTAKGMSDLLKNLEQIKLKSINTSENIITAMREVSSANQDIEAAGKKLEDLHKEIEGSEEGDASLEKQRKRLEEEEDDIKAKIAQLKNVKIVCDSQINNIKAELAKISKEKTAAKKYLETRQLSEKALLVLKEVYERFSSEKRIEIEKGIIEIFNKLIWKDAAFPYVKLTDDYRLEVFDRYGSPAREELSAGERQVLSLSFIASMASTVGGDVPLVMDTPFGRLHSEHRANIVKQIPMMTKQFILMVQDEELVGKAKEILRERIGEEYLLNFEKGCTRIVEV